MQGKSTQRLDLVRADEQKMLENVNVCTMNSYGKFCLATAKMGRPEVD
jgi:hypothetical protein